MEVQLEVVRAVLANVQMQVGMQFLVRDVGMVGAQVVVL